MAAATHSTFIQKGQALGLILLVGNVGITSYVFDVDQTGGFDFTTAPVLSNVNANYSSADGTSNDYGPMTAQWVTVGVVKKVDINQLHRKRYW